MIVNIIGTLAKFKLISLFFGIDEIKKTKAIFYISTFYIFNCLIFILSPVPVLLLFSNIFGIFFLTFSYRGTLKNRITATVFVTLIAAAVEIVLMSLFDYRKISIFKVQELHSVSMIITSNITLYAISLILSEKKSNLKKYSDVSILYWLGIVSVPVASLILMILFLSISNGNEQVQILIAILAVTIINTVSFQLYKYIVVMLQEENKKLILQKQNEYYMQQLKMSQADNANISLIHHDMKNHLFALKSLYDKGETDSYRNYFDSILSKIDKKEDFCKSGNFIIDSIINYKLRDIEDADICIDVCIPKELNLPDMDITAMLGNILDNSIRAIKEAGEIGKKPVFHIKMSYTKGRFIIKAENSYRNVNMSQGKFQTTKSETKDHGIGLESIKDVVEKYNGILQVNCDNNLFVTEIVLFFG